MTSTVLTPLAEATDAEAFGGKAAQLAAALRAGLPVPDGFALDFASVRTTIVEGAARALASVPGVDEPWAVRSSAIGEDSEDASFAGTHVSVLGVVGSEAMAGALEQVYASALDPAAIAYREQHGLDPTPRMAVVLQRMVASEVAGVLFTRNPVTGADERLIEASWGLGEMVVSGQITPDQYRLDPAGNLVERTPGEKDLALFLRPDGAVEEAEVDPDLIDAYCLDQSQLLALHRLSRACDDVYGMTEHDIEFAFASGRLHLLQRRPITHG